MKLIKVYNFEFNQDINYYSASYPTGEVETEVDVNTTAIESICKRRFKFYKPKYTKYMKPTWFGLGKPEEITRVEKEFSHVVEYLQLTMFSGEKFLIKDNTLSNLKVINDDISN